VLALSILFYSKVSDIVRPKYVNALVLLGESILVICGRTKTPGPISFCRWKLLVLLEWIRNDEIFRSSKQIYFLIDIGAWY